MLAIMTSLHSLTTHPPAPIANGDVHNVASVTPAGVVRQIDRPAHRAHMVTGEVSALGVGAAANARQVASVQVGVGRARRGFGAHEAVCRRTVLHHLLQELDDHLGGRPDENLALATLLGVEDRAKAVIEHRNAHHDAAEEHADTQGPSATTPARAHWRKGSERQRKAQRRTVWERARGTAFDIIAL